MPDRLRVLLVAGALLVVPGAAVAQPVARPLAAEHRLTAAEIDAVLDAAARRRETGEASDAKADVAWVARPPSVEGEIGFGIGTSGYRSAFGSAYIPLPGQGSIAVSVGAERGPIGY